MILLFILATLDTFVFVVYVVHVTGQYILIVSQDWARGRKKRLEWDISIPVKNWPSLGVIDLLVNERCLLSQWPIGLFNNAVTLPTICFTCTVNTCIIALTHFTCLTKSHLSMLPAHERNNYLSVDAILFGRQWNYCSRVTWHITRFTSYLNHREKFFFCLSPSLYSFLSVCVLHTAVHSCEQTKCVSMSIETWTWWSNIILFHWDEEEEREEKGRLSDDHGSNVNWLVQSSVATEFTGRNGFVKWVSSSQETW